MRRRILFLQHLPLAQRNDKHNKSFSMSEIAICYAAGKEVGKWNRQLPPKGDLLRFLAEPTPRAEAQSVGCVWNVVGAANN